MREIYLSDRELQMSRGESDTATEPRPTSPPIDPAALAAQQIRKSLDGKHVCPFCGSVTEDDSGACPRCTMENTPATRKATKDRIGPWYVLQSRNPAAPGMRFDTLLSFVRKGRVKARSIVRGPTTHQLWRFAAQVKGLSREFGVCYGCGGPVENKANRCPHCSRTQTPPVNPDTLLETAAAAVVREPDLRVETEEAEIVVSALSGADDSLAGFKLDPPPGDSIAGVPVVPRNGPTEKPRVVVRPPASAPASGAPRQSQRPAEAPRPAASSARPAPASPSREARPTPRVAPKSDSAPRESKPAGEAFLSAKELATAFKLGLDTNGNYAAANAPNFAAARSPEAAARFDPTRRRKPRRWGRGLLLLVVLAGGGYGALMWVDPAVRSRTLQWVNAAWGKGLDMMTPIDVDRANGQTKALAPAAQTQAKPTGPNVDSATLAATRVDATPKVSPKAEPSPAATQKANSESWDEAFSQATAGAAAASPSSRPATTAPAPVVEKAAPTPPPPPEPTPAEQVASMWRLYGDALDAEGRGDYDAALRDYEQIKKLPPNIWVGGLEIRIENARKAKLQKAGH